MDLVEQLNHIFYPRAIAVIGASANPEKVGFICLSNLLEAGFKGRIYPVNPGLSELFGLRAYPSIGATPGEVDLAIIAIPAELTISAIEECVANGVKGAIVTSGGFREAGTAFGFDLQAKIRDIANKGGIKIIGPNALGLLNPRVNLNATLGPTFGLINVGSVAIATQSGGMCDYIAHALTNHNLGISKAIGLGNRCNLDFDEVVTYFGEDEDTKVIIIYIEGLEQPQQLMHVARHVVRRKPIIAYKGGRGEDLNGATLSHTGALAGRYEFYKAAFDQAGIITINDTTELVDAAKALAFQPPAWGNRVAVLSVQAGPGIVMADKCHELGLTLAKFSPATRQRLRQFVSSLNANYNPFDVSWNAGQYDACREVLKVILDDKDVDGVTVAALSAQWATELIRAILAISKNYEKPLTVCLNSPGGAASTQLDALEQSRIPTYPLPERAVTGLAGLVRYGRILKAM